MTPPTDAELSFGAALGPQATLTRANRLHIWPSSKLPCHLLGFCKRKGRALNTLMLVGPRRGVPRGSWARWCCEGHLSCPASPRTWHDRCLPDGGANSCFRISSGAGGLIPIEMDQPRRERLVMCEAMAPDFFADGTDDISSTNAAAEGPRRDVVAAADSCPILALALVD